jgi:TDG/mug DNA glycosylase family protein
MARVTGFPPVVQSHTRALILGSMPGRASLEQNQYYGLPRNAFWKIMGDLFDAGMDLPYRSRLLVLSHRLIGLWDVLESCDRKGSLDSSIDSATVRPNDFASFYRHAVSIQHVFFNGRKAEEIYMRRVLPTVKDEFFGIEYHALPSTSPAHASISYAEKLESWSAIIAALSD